MNTEPKSFYTKIGQPLEKNKRLVIALAACICAVILFVVYKNQPVSKKTEIKATSTKDESTFYSKSEIDNLIKGQLSKKESDQKEKIVQIQAKPTEKRKLKTAIAVFIKAAEEKKPAPTVTENDKSVEIPTGSKIKAHLANAIFSFNVTSPVVAVVDEDFVKDEQVIIPKGTQFIGDAGILKSRDRINVRFSVMVLPSGKETKVSAMALGLDGSGGIKGRLDKQSDKSIFKALGETLLAGSAVVLGRTNNALSLSDELRLNTARNLSDDARNSLNQVKIEESVSVEAYTPILVLFLDPL